MASISLYLDCTQCSSEVIHRLVTSTLLPHFPNWLQANVLLYCPPPRPVRTGGKLKKHTRNLIALSTEVSAFATEQCACHDRQWQRFRPRDVPLDPTIGVRGRIQLDWIVAAETLPGYYYVLYPRRYFHRYDQDVAGKWYVHHRLILAAERMDRVWDG